MKEFTVTIDRTVHQVRTLTVKAENEEQARTVAKDTADSNEGWEGKDYCVETSIHIEEVPNDYIDRYGNPYDVEDPNACWPAGGGLHKDCEFNADALYAYYVVKSSLTILSSGSRVILRLSLRTMTPADTFGAISTPNLCSDQAGGILKQPRALIKKILAGKFGTRFAIV